MRTTPVNSSVRAAVDTVVECEFEQSHPADPRRTLLLDKGAAAA
jgi:hypothetical protein